MERRLKAKARKIGLTGDRFENFVHGTLKRIPDVEVPKKKRKTISEGIQERKR